MAVMLKLAVTAAIEKCFARGIDIKNSFDSNVDNTILQVHTRDGCERLCQLAIKKGCKFFVWNQLKFQCTLFKGIEHIVYTGDSHRLIGSVEGCLGCYRTGWDYIKAGNGYNLQGHGSVWSVPDINSCARICYNSYGCKYVSFHARTGNCYLKTADAEEADSMLYDKEYKSCRASGSGCVAILDEVNFADGFFGSYDVIGSGASAPIPGVSTASDCQEICLWTNKCKYWTWDKEHRNCYLVSQQNSLRYSDGKISGSRNCHVDKNMF